MAFRHIVAFALLLFISPAFFSQEELLKAGYENGSNLNVIYRTERTGKIYASTRGFGFTFRQAKHVTAKRKSFFEVDAQTLKYPKEKKVQGDAATRKRYVYGKVNYVMVLRGDLGLQNVITTKADNRAVEIRYSYSLGPTIAFAKPYYIKVFKQGGKEAESMLFDSESFTQGSSVDGRAPFTEGLDETKLYPGASAKFNLSFEYAPYTNLVRAIETGICFDFFPKALPIMARNPAENFIITFNVAFVFGRRWF